VTNGKRIIYLARHGETEWNRIGRWQGVTDIPISDVGREQALALAERLRRHGIARLHASHLARALETARIVAAQLELPAPAVDPRLRERGYGVFEGLTREECAARHPIAWERYLADRRAVPPQAEPPEDVVARITAAMHAIATADHPAASTPGATLVVSHGGTIRSFLHAAFGVMPPPLGNGTVYRVRFEAGAFVAADELDT
jgi:broad specificity phosphatase PhoE